MVMGLGERSLPQNFCFYRQRDWGKRRGRFFYWAAGAIYSGLAKGVPIFLVSPLATS